MQLHYAQQQLKLRGVGGNEMQTNDGTTAASAKTVVVLTGIDLPGGYRHAFSYYGEQAVAGNDNGLGSGRVSRIVTPSGATHSFSYQQFAFHTFEIPIATLIKPNEKTYNEIEFPDAPNTTML